MKILYSLLFIALYSCSETAAEKRLLNGKKLAEVYCSTCHAFAEPGLLDKKTWISGVLPKMGSFIGFRQFESTTYFEDDYAKPNITLDDWNDIVRFYVTLAPDSLTRMTTNLPKIDTTLRLFRTIRPNFNLSSPATSYAGIFPESKEIIFTDGLTRRMYRVKDMQLTDSMEIETGISQVVQSNSRLMVLAMGVMYPSDDRLGKLERLDKHHSELVLDSLQRPVYAEYADLNNDSLEDIIICAFGNNTGELSWFEQQKQGLYQKHVLKPLPGAIKTIARDFNNDGKKDIMALMAQADEGLYIFYNEGNNRFREHRILRFSPVYGSNYFELADINKDGFDDILATNGDNGDQSPILKPYHGIRIFIHNGQSEYKQKVFLPVNGACKAIARDFDQDGDIDIASISYFPDFEQRPYESFIYWQNTGGLSFTPHSVPAATEGRWLVMDAGDIDGDGDEDIVLGNAKSAMGTVPDPVMKRWNAGSPSIILLKNQLHADAK